MINNIVKIGNLVFYYLLPALPFIVLGIVLLVIVKFRKKK